MLHIMTKSQVKYSCSPSSFLVIPFRKVTNSAGSGARQSTSDFAQLVHVDQIRPQYESKTLAFKRGGGV